jgi:hypothetical protein
MILVDRIGEIRKTFIHIEPKIPAEELLRRNEEEMRQLTDRQCELVKIPDKEKTDIELAESPTLNGRYIEMRLRSVYQERDLVLLQFIRLPYFPKDLKR